MTSETNTQLSMPGFNEKLNVEPKENVLDGYTPGFRMALDGYLLVEGYIEDLVTHRELLMMRVMNNIIEKPDWDTKVFDEEITTKWRNEIAQSGQDVTTKMMDWIIKELQWKTKVFKEKGFVTVFDVGVVRSDTAVSKELQDALKDAVKALEDVPEDKKDYHPNSDEKVVDLVHPSLFPVIYGRTRVLPETIINLENCFNYIGQGETIPEPPKEDCSNPRLTGYHWRAPSDGGWPCFSTKFQWLPCDVELLENDECRIVSYINNAHPVHHKSLYKTVEKIIARAVPLWEQSLPRNRSRRIVYDNVEYGEPSDPQPIRPDHQAWKLLSMEQKDEFWRKYDEWRAARPIVRPEPGEFVPQTKKKLNMRKRFPNTKLQVIVKLANIELTPEKPSYDGGSWHIEGQMNERICATAIYYFDNENITDNTLDFRQRGMADMMDLNYEQSEHQFLQQVFGFGDDVSGSGRGDITQDLGGVICKEGRLLAFPNTVQHRVSPFSLADPSNPGHRKILALFLVDPHRRVISSANVPPQREDWGMEKQGLVDEAISGLPTELQHMIAGDLHPLMKMEEAKALRLELMDERGRRSKYTNEAFETGSFNLCEH